MDWTSDRNCLKLQPDRDRLILQILVEQDKLDIIANVLNKYGSDIFKIIR